MLGKILIFLFSMLGIFGLIMATMPYDFIIAGTVYNPSYRDAEIQEEFDANNLVIYDSSESDNMTYPYTSLEDAPSAPQWSAGLPADNFLEVGWGLEWDTEGLQCIKVRQRLRHTFPWTWWSTVQDCSFYTSNSSSVGLFLYKSTLEDYYSDGTNGSAFYVKGGSIQSSFIVKRWDEAQTIGENWDDGHLQYYLSYEINWNQTGINAWSIVGQLLAFQAPSFGIPGEWGYFMQMLIAIPMWSGIAYICYKIIMGIIPFVSGGSGD